jgi:hypothetical protein
MSEASFESVNVRQIPETSHGKLLQGGEAGEH